jgi:hypothetical protein
MIQQSELIVLVVAIALSPFILWTYHGIDLEAKRWLTAGLVAVICADTVTIVEGFVWPDFFNAVEHASFAAAGICFAVLAFGLLRESTPADIPGQS